MNLENITVLSDLRSRLWKGFISVCLILSCLILPLGTPAPALAELTFQPDLQRLDTYVEQSIAQAKVEALQQAAESYQQFRAGWSEIEDTIRNQDRAAYRAIETAMGQVRLAFSTPSVKAEQVIAALQRLQGTTQAALQGDLSATATSPTRTVTIAALLQQLNQAQTALDMNNVGLVTEAMQQFQTDWVEVEGLVAAKSRETYSRIENTMTQAVALLQATPPDSGAAQTAIAQLEQMLEPFNQAQPVRYTLFDSAVILLREGMEALLVLVALLAFLTKSGNAEQGRWLWVGAGVGILASIATALVIQLVFANIAVGSNRELLEGLTGLTAAILLFYVSYWLHSKSSLQGWQGYIQEQATAALATNRVFSLAFLAFLAVYREGAETVLFYIGIAPSISTSDLLGGLGLALVGLVAIAWLMFGIGLQIPLKPFFSVTSLLIYYLGFKFVGSGIHALQVAGYLQVSTAPFLPAVPFLGLYPTWETTLPQIALLLGSLLVILYPRPSGPQDWQSKPE